jgi:hypothetical protein
MSAVLDYIETPAAATVNSADTGVASLNSVTKRYRNGVLALDNLPLHRNSQTIGR